MVLRSCRGFFAMSALSTCVLGQLITGLLGSLGLGCSPPEQALLTCKAISDLDVPTLIWPVSDLNADYSYAKNHYWNNANAQFTPACVVLPTCATHVSQAVQVLLQYPDVNFAVKSGGHNANVGFSSTNGGVLIYFKNMNQTTLSWDESTADVQPGARWENAIQALEPYNRTIVGGRVGDVGVGGLLLGCGLSFLSSQYGLPCDNILNYEVVLSNARIVNANATSNPDLFWALKGGGSQFGIVTRFTLRTYPIGAIWGGIRTYSRDYSEQILIATQDFTENFPDPRAGIIVTVEFVADSLDEFWVLFFFYNGPNLPIGVFDKFLSIPSTTDTTKEQKYSELLISNNAEASIYGLRYLLRGTTIPNLPGAYGTNVAITNYNSFIDYIEEESLVDITFIYSLIYQPIPYSIAAASAQVNPTGNLLGISADSGDHMWMAMTIGWVLDANDADAAQQAEDIINDIAAYPKVTYPGVKNSNYKAGNLSQEEYSPTVFMNDASADQKVLQGYGDITYQRLKAVQEEVDPIEFFPTRTGGFKLT